MDKLYCLTFYTQSDGEYRQGFHIGLFSGYEKAANVQLHYFRHVPGFKDYDCAAEITAVPVIGRGGNRQNVYRFVGWNENENADEIDILESDCYTEQKQAQAAYEKAQRTTPRQEWAFNCHHIDQCHWQEGFVCS